MSNPNAPFADSLGPDWREPLEHTVTCGYQVEFRTVALTRDMSDGYERGGYTLASDGWRTIGEFPTVQDAEYEVDALRIAGGPTMRVRWRALVSSDRFA